jgi:hypothetical protein
MLEKIWKKEVLGQKLDLEGSRGFFGKFQGLMEIGFKIWR